MLSCAGGERRRCGHVTLWFACTQTRQRGSLGEGNAESKTHTTHFPKSATFAALTKASFEHEQLHARAYQHAGGDDTDHDLEERTHCE